MISAIRSQKDKGVAQSGGYHAHLLQKDIEKKANLTEQRQDAKKYLIFNILLLWAKCMLINFEFQQGLFCILSNCQT